MMIAVGMTAIARVQDEDCLAHQCCINICAASGWLEFALDLNFMRHHVSIPAQLVMHTAKSLLHTKWFLVRML